MIDKKVLRRFYLDAVYGRTGFDQDSAATYGFGEQAFQEIRARCIPRKTPACRYCGREVPELDCVITHTYWQAMMDIAHAGCDAAGQEEEAFECQCIDADCNDCRHFRRDIHLQNEGFNGRCLKFNEPTRACVNFASGHPCFEHRRHVEGQLPIAGQSQSEASPPAPPLHK
jgi:hypothetical protein